MKFKFLDLSAVILIVFSILCLVFFKSLSVTATDVLKALVALCSFFLFGSTSGSKLKDENQSESNSKMIDALKDSTPANSNKTEITEDKPDIKIN